MPALKPAEVERRALALFERLSDAVEDPALRIRLMEDEPTAVRARAADLARSAEAAAAALPTGEAWLSDVLDPPERVGNYRIVSLIGQGGMGAVWLAERDDGLFEHRVAVKFIHGRLHARAAERFTAERRILARLEHPGIARLIDGGVTDAGQSYLVMEYVEGLPIDVAAAALAPAERVALFVQAAEAAQFAHGRLVAHADLKPSNIVVDAAGRVRLLDFGVARLIGEDEPGAERPMTRAYASPRRQAGEPPTTADDVFALGVILDGLIADVRDLDLQAIGAKARAPDEAARYGSAAELIADLHRWAAREPVTARAQTVRYRLGRFVSRHRAGVAFAAAAFLLLAGAALSATLSYLAADRARAEATARFEDVRATARYLLFELSDELERVPGALPLRARVAAVSQTYLDRLSASPHAPPQVRLESVAGLLQLAERQGSPGRPNLGQPEAARANYRRALAALEDLAGPDADRLRAQGLIGLARLEANSFNDFEAADRALAAAQPLVAGAAPAAGQRPFHLNALSEVRQWQGRYAEARKLAALGDAAAAALPARARLMAQADAANLLGDAIYYGGDHAGAVAHYRRQVELLSEGVRRWPGDPTLERRLARAYWALASALLDLGKTAEALAQVDAATALAERIARAEPRDADAQRMRRIIGNVRAQGLAASGRTEEALAILQESAAERLARWRAEPGDASRGRDYAIALAMIADVEADAGRTQAACRRYAQVQGLFADLRRLGRLADLDAENSLKLLGERRARHCG